MSAVPLHRPSFAPLGLRASLLLGFVVVLGVASYAICVRPPRVAFRLACAAGSCDVALELVAGEGQARP